MVETRAARVIGTAGHVDHGKSTLVHRLTGMDPDRLAEEKARSLTIDLGFAWLTLPGGQSVGIVDVPGHRDFIENMLAGVGGIDAALLVIAADEGVMPQTREHLNILSLLGIQYGLVALTKADLIDDPDWLDLVETDVYDLLAQSTLRDAEVIRVSARTGHNLDGLVNRLGALVAGLPSNSGNARPRLPIDRVFSISGFGTVVTGTLQGGPLRTGDEVEIVPGTHRARIRGLQSHKAQVEVAYPGSRVAVNLSGIDRDRIGRGHVLALPDAMRPTTLLDAHLTQLSDASRPLKHNAQVKLFTGTAEVMAHARVLSDDMIAPGQQGWVQFRLEDPIAAARGDRFIVRIPSPPETIAGGTILDAHPARRWKRHAPNVLARLERLLNGGPAQRIAEAARGKQPLNIAELQKRTDLDAVTFEESLPEAFDSGLLIQLTDDLVMATDSYNELIDQAERQLAEYHRANPLRLGMPREELRSRLGIKANMLTALLDRTDSLQQRGPRVHLNSHAIRFTPAQETRIAELSEMMEAAPYTPPSYVDAAAVTGEDVLNALIDLDQIAQVTPDVIFSRSAYDALVSGALELIDTHGSVDARSLRDRFDTSRKYAIALLEHLDAAGITRRVGDDRIRANNA